MVEMEELYPDGKSGKGIVDHPVGGKHDLLQAMVGAYWNLLNNEWWAPTNTGYTPDTERVTDVDKKAVYQMNNYGKWGTDD